MPLRWFLILLGLAAAQPALAQQQAPPARVGAVTYVSGNIAFHTAGETQWSAAGVNYPVATGGSFWTDPQSRAELQIGPATIDMAGGTEIDVTQLDEEVAQIALPQGRLYLHLRALGAGQSFEIDLPQGAVWALQPGTYDIDAGSAAEPARVAVFDGSARFVGGGADIGIKSGDAALLSGSSPLAVQVARAMPDAFVDWCRARDYRPAQVAAASHYVSPQMTGYADLDQYGSWQQSPQYGEVWYPSQVPADWAPYRDGRWVWVEPWGWTWVGAQPWGFAPFHYGRWAYVNDRWGWVPGQYQPQPVYAPALVAFVGAAAGGLALASNAGPAVGWFPLAPGEAYWPSYTHNRNYIRNINTANVRDINTVVNRSNGTPPPQAATANFANRRFATIVPRQVFANADPVAPHTMHVAPAALAKAPVALHPPALKPAAKPAAVAARGPATTRPVPRGPGAPPSAHPGTEATRPPESHPQAPGTSPADGSLPGHAGPPGHPAAAAAGAAPPPLHPGAANPNAHGPHPAPGTSAAREPGHVPLPPEHGVEHPPAVSHRAAPPPAGAAERPPAHEARPGAPAPGHPPVAGPPREAPPRSAAPPEHRPAIGNEPRPAPPAAHAQMVRPPEHPAPARPLAPPHPTAAPPHPAAAPHPPAPAVVRAPPAPHPPSRPVAAAPRPPAPHPPAPHPAPAHAAPAPHGAEHPGEKHE